MELPRTVHVLCLGTLLNRAGTLLLPFLTLYLTAELGYSERFATLGMGAIGAGSIIGALVGGHLADRIGRRVVMVGSLFGSAGVLLVFGWMRSPAAILAVLVLFSSLADMYRPAAAAMISDLVPPDERPYAFGLMYLAINVGFPIGTVVGGLLAARWFRGLFVVDAATAAAYAAIILMFVGESLPNRRRRSAVADSDEAKSDGEARAEGAGATDSLAAAAAHIARNLPFLTFCFGSFLMGLTFMQSFSTLPLYMEHVGIAVDRYGQLVAINGVMIAVLQIPLTTWMKRYNRVWFVIAAPILTGIGFGTTAYVTHSGGFAATIMIWTLGEIMIAPYGPSIVSDMAPVALRARYLGVFTMCFASANMLGAPLGGLILECFGGKTLWSMAWALCFAAALLFLTIRKTLSTGP